MMPDNENKSADTFENNIRNTLPETDQMENKVEVNNQNNGQLNMNPTVPIRERGTMRVKRKKRIIIFSILAVILLVGGYFTYDLFLKDLLNKKEEETENEIDINTINISNGYLGNSNFISIPQIDVDTKEASLLNLKIMTDSYKTIDFLRKSFFDKVNNNNSKNDFEDFYDCYKNLKYDYKVYRKKGILIISVSADNASRNWNNCILEKEPTYDNPEYFYFYDVKNDKGLNFYDAVEQLGVSVGSDYSMCKNYTELRNYTGKITVKSDALGDLDIQCIE